MPRNPIYRDVAGAPFKLGERVRVVGPGDETFDPRYLGRSGTVVYLEYGCGCGQTYPGDPMIGVRFRNTVEEEFWKAELLHVVERNSLKPRRAGAVAR